MADRHQALRDAVEDSVLRGAGHTDPSLRRAIASRGEVPPELRALVDKVRTRAWTVADADLDALKRTYTDDQIFEIVLAAALGAARERLNAGLSALAGP
jgi:alkylhydroperoxidase family enzyme